ncbi:DUF1573 domain-containing protein [Ferruginibacter sp.]|uniref:DUF1573 domain-containing protein n=1 Tax=Ferruginibacter sp. TaxID=1940288 RepID=UPI00265B4939|nr:DUF1573 domain-containing protein [Ferruginibacter sp.]
MKKYVLFLMIINAFSSCDVRRKDKVADGTASLTGITAMDSTTIQIIDTAYNFGTVSEGEKVTYNFRFKNNGSKPLVVTDTHASCGCTVPEKPEKPVMPGETSFIKVVFNSKGKVGHNEKTITVVSNANPAFPPLILRGEITPVK